GWASLPQQAGRDRRLARVALRATGWLEPVSQQPSTNSIRCVSRAIARTVRGSESLGRGESTATTGTLRERSNQRDRAHNTAHGRSDHDRHETEDQCPPRRSNPGGG